MTVHREGRDFTVVLETYDTDNSMNLQGEGGANVRPGDFLITIRGGLERWKVEAVERLAVTFVAKLAPVVPLRLVPSECDVAAVAESGNVVNLFGAR